MSIFNKTLQLHASEKQSKLYDGRTAKQLLDLDEDVLFEICSTLQQHDRASNGTTIDSRGYVAALLAFCSSCRHLRSIGAPLALAQPKVLTDCEDGFTKLPSLDPWLVYVGTSSWFLRYMRTLRIKLFILADEDAVRLGLALMQTTSLRELHLLTPRCREKTQANIRKAFNGCKFSMLHTLVISAGLEDLITLGTSERLTIQNEAPHLGASSDMLQLYATQGHLRTITRLELGPTSTWSPLLLRLLSEHLPALKTLGTLAGGSPGYSYEALLKQVNLFPALELLTTAPVNEIGLRHLQYTCSSDACRALSWLCDDHLPTAVDYAGHLTFSTLPKLQTLQFQQVGRLGCSHYESEDDDRFYADPEYAETTVLGRLQGHRNLDGSVAALTLDVVDNTTADSGKTCRKLQLGRR